MLTGLCSSLCILRECNWPDDACEVFVSFLPFLFPFFLLLFVLHFFLFLFFLFFFSALVFPRLGLVAGNWAENTDYQFYLLANASIAHVLCFARNMSQLAFSSSLPVFTHGHAYTVSFPNADAVITNARKSILGFLPRARFWRCPSRVHCQCCLPLTFVINNVQCLAWLLPAVHTVYDCVWSVILLPGEVV